MVLNRSIQITRAPVPSGAVAGDSTSARRILSGNSPSSVHSGIRGRFFFCQVHWLLDPTSAMYIDKRNEVTKRRTLHLSKFISSRLDAMVLEGIGLIRWQVM